VNIYSGEVAVDLKRKRQEYILNMIKNEKIETQSELVDRLSEAGYSCTQASVSRDVRALNLTKRDGYYLVPEAVLPDLDNFSSAVGCFMQQIELVGENLVVVKALPGTAHSVAIFLDRCDWPEIAGTVAGDDTIFVAVHNREKGQQFKEKLVQIGES
jgi:transcriptional regulator of arginine metabolism